MATVAALVGCEGDKGPAGPPGTASCMNCHTDDYTMVSYIRAIQTEYTYSHHANAATFVRRGSESSPTCGHCHTTEGYQHFVATGEEIDVETSSPIGCFACHAPHTNEDFSLRKQGPTAMWTSDEVFDKAEANTCAMCHQARPPVPAIENIATPITSSRWGPHHSPQANVLAGLGAYEFDGPYSTNHGHNNIANGCVNCHMAEVAQDALAGGHTFAINYETSSGTRVNSKGCVACHGDLTDAQLTTKVDDAQEEFEEGLHALRDALIALGWVQANGEQVIPANIPATADARGAIWNYFLLDFDLSISIHNPAFAEDVLEATMEYVDAQRRIAGL
jgi:formate-dependent nitrite reductase cytochrome c552 subunit